MTAPAERTVAAFDFDGTLTRHDSLIPFLARVAGWPRVLAAATMTAPGFVRAAIGRGDRDGSKATLLGQVLAGRPYDEVARAGDSYGTALVSRAIRPDMRKRLQWHRAQGHEVVIVSASLFVYLETVARLLDAQGVLCTRLEVDTDGACTGQMLGGNCRGPEKALRLTDYLGNAPATLWSYGDSAGDSEMLAMADHPIRVRRGRLR